MRCPRCQKNDTRVIDSRPVDDNTAIRRRRVCQQCDFRFTTYERVEQSPLRVIKKDGTHEEFSREKLLRGLVRAAEKRPVSLDTLKNLVREIESELRQECEKEVTSEAIGEKVMDKLPEIDKVAYIRYASVYRDFKDMTGFETEIERLNQRQESTGDKKSASEEDYSEK